MNRINPINLIRSYLPMAVLGIAGLLFVLSAADIFAADLVLFDLLPVHIAVFALLLFTLGLTVFACMDQLTRRPLALLACLLQTPMAGGLLLLYVYEWAFPDHLPLSLILPFVVLLVAIASALQAGVLILCTSLYAEDDPDAVVTAVADEEEDDLSFDDLDVDAPVQKPQKQPTPAAVKAEQPVPAAKAAPAAEKAPAPAPKAAEQKPAPAPVKLQEEKPVAPVKVPTAVAPVTPEDEEELAPIPKKQNKYQPSFETAHPPMVPVVPKATPIPSDSDEDMKIVGQPAEKKAAKPQEKKKAYTDPFGLLTEEVKAEQTTVKFIFSDPDSNEQ